MLHKPILLIIFGGLFLKELANEDLKTKQELLPGVLSLGCGQNNLKLGSFPQHKKVNGRSTTTRTLSETQSLGDKNGAREYCNKLRTEFGLLIVSC